MQEKEYHNRVRFFFRCHIRCHFRVHPPFLCSKSRTSERKIKRQIVRRTPKSYGKIEQSRLKRTFQAALLWRSERDLNFGEFLLSLTKVSLLPQNAVEPEHLLTTFDHLKPPITIPIREKIRENLIHPHSRYTRLLLGIYIKRTVTDFGHRPLFVLICLIFVHFKQDFI